MSARERIESLWDRSTPIGPLLDEFAHELAEQQSEHIESRRDDDDYDEKWMADEIILLIDPQTKGE